MLLCAVIIVTDENGDGDQNQYDDKFCRLHLNLLTGYTGVSINSTTFTTEHTEATEVSGPKDKGQIHASGQMNRTFKWWRGTHLRGIYASVPSVISVAKKVVKSETADNAFVDPFGEQRGDAPDGVPLVQLGDVQVGFHSVIPPFAHHFPE